MRALVTGAAGFIGSHLCERLRGDGWHVSGVDAYTDHYDAAIKRANVAAIEDQRGFVFAEVDLSRASSDDLARLLDGVDVVFHLAAQPGVRSSWSTGFERCVRDNVDATQRLLQAIVERPRPVRLVFASSSSVYGEAVTTPTTESCALRPHSPYGVTKVAGELLVAAYSDNFGLDATCLRFFSVYGPRQRPDMAVHRMIEAALTKRSFPLLGDGSNVRDLTYVSDAVEACVRVAELADLGVPAFNVAGGSECSVLGLLQAVGEELGEVVAVDEAPEVAGDVARTSGDVTLITSTVGWKPEVSLAEGLAAQVAWHRQRHRQVRPLAR